MIETAKKNITILFVDDDPVFLEIIQISMEDLDYTPLFSSSAEEALAIMEQQFVHIVVTDIWMPVMNGFELLKIIKEKFPYTPVLALTSDNELKSAIDFMRQGGSNYIKKSSDQEELEMALDSAIKHWSVLDELRLTNETLHKKNKALKKVIHKQRETYFQLKKAKELAESADTEKSRLLANMSHELRTPLHGITSYVNFLINDNQLNAIQKEKLNTIHQCSETMLSLINDSLLQLEELPITLNDQSKKEIIESKEAKDGLSKPLTIDPNDIKKIGITQPIEKLYVMVQEGDIESIKEWCTQMNQKDSIYNPLTSVIFKWAETYQISLIESILYQYFFKKKE
jgi:CheY-like chemotaxis protein